MYLMRFLSPDACISMAATHIGVSKDQLLALLTLARSHLRDATGHDHDIAGSFKALATKDFNFFRGLYDRVLGNPAIRPHVPLIAAEWLRENDKDGIGLKALGAVKSLPLVHVSGDHESVEDFIERGLLPLLDDVFVVPDNCCSSCRGAVQIIDESLTYCSACDLFGDTHV